MEYNRFTYRAKSLRTGEWVFGDLHLNAGHPHIHVDAGTSELIDVQTVGQFVAYIPNTDLYVDNSWNLFEGDIVSLKGRDTVYTIKWDKHSCRFRGISDDEDEYGPYTFSIDKHKLKIIKQAK